METSRLARDRTVEPVSRGQILRRERGQGNIHFSCSADHEQDWQPYPVDPYSCYSDPYSYMYGHTYSKSMRLPILHVVSSTGKMNISLSAFAPENLISRDGFGSPVLRQPAHLHTQGESGAYLRDSSRIPRRRPFIYLNHHTPSGQSRVYRVTQLRTNGVHCRESAGTGPVNLKVVPNECCLGRSPCVFCVFSSHPFWTSSSLDVPAGVTQEEGHTGFLIHLPSAVRALIFVARRIQPFLSLVDREVEFCVLTN